MKSLEIGRQNITTTPLWGWKTLSSLKETHKYRFENNLKFSSPANIFSSQQIMFIKIEKTQSFLAWNTALIRFFHPFPLLPFFQCRFLLRILPYFERERWSEWIWKIPKYSRFFKIYIGRGRKKQTKFQSWRNFFYRIKSAWNTPDDPSFLPEIFQAAIKFKISRLPWNSLAPSVHIIQI